MYKVAFLKKALANPGSLGLSDRVDDEWIGQGPVRLIWRMAWLAGRSGDVTEPSLNQPRSAGPEAHATSPPLPPAPAPA